ncbi:glutamyl-tRNA reductase [Halosimplex rubrum]|uniref:Glutamyl-tRNA reductase n=1 Tax=Halosimplex rubrum TaxID=869889 RepID=A0A7D5TQS9_9EURY|nr:glutamyl-tRNA reductase [Halosimplex rubrum]QLH79134.1 glutamyl-tRNA reductase [Halosimplex rubrum]
MTVGTGVISGASVDIDRATVDELEAATVESQRAGVERLLSVPAVEEAYVLQTCNRVEAYVVTGDGHDGRAALAAFFEGVPGDVLVELGHEESLRHLMRVAAGLESLVVGEDQILGQVGDAYEDARAAGGVGRLLEEGVTKAIHVGERARTETAINEGSVSLASAAVTLADEEVGVDDAEALVVGAGEMGRLAAQSLATRVGHLYVANRTVERAEHLAETLDADATVVELGDLDETVERAAVVVTATGSTDYVFEKSTVSDTGETFVVDIAQPRDVQPTVTELPDVTVRDLDALQTVTDENRAQRAEAATAVEEMIDVEFEHLLAQYKRKRADRVISAMYESAERVKAQEVETALDKGDFDESQREVIEAMADAVVNQLLAAPTKSLRDAAEEDDWSTINTALQLFDPEFGGESDSETADGDEIPKHLRDQMADAVFDQLGDD